MSSSATAQPAASTRGIPHAGAIAAAIALGVIIVDLATKHWAVSSLQRGRPRHVLWTLQWNLTSNRGMAFSTGQGAGVLIGLAALVVAVAVLVWTPRATSRLTLVAAGLVVGGALGNVVDRLFRGRGWLRGGVVDFIDFQWFPIFNVADMAVNVGAGCYLLWVLLDARASARRRPAR